MPIYNWLKWHEDKDDKWLSKKGKAGLLTSYIGNKLMTQFIERFGFSETFIKALEKEKELVLLQARMAITEDRSLSAKFGQRWQNRSHHAKRYGRIL